MREPCETFSVRVLVLSRVTVADEILLWLRTGNPVLTGRVPVPYPR